MAEKTQVLNAQQAAYRAYDDDEETIDLLELAQYLWRRIIYIALAVMAGATLTFAVCVFIITPKYSSTAMMYVNNSNISLGNTSLSIDSGDLTASRGLVDTYIVILNTRETLEEVIKEAGVDYTYEELSDMIEAEAVDSTEVFSVTVTSTDPDEAASIANVIVAVLPLRIKAIIDGSSAVRVDAAVSDPEPVSPKILRNTAVGALVGLVAACGVFVVMFLMDTEIHSESYLLKNYPTVPLLAVVPNVNAVESNRYGYGYSYGYAAKHSAAKKAEEKKGA